MQSMISPLLFKAGVNMKEVFQRFGLFWSVFFKAICPPTWGALSGGNQLSVGVPKLFSLLSIPL